MSTTTSYTQQVAGSSCLKMVSAGLKRLPFATPNVLRLPCNNSAYLSTRPHLNTTTAPTAPQLPKTPLQLLLWLQAPQKKSTPCQCQGCLKKVVSLARSAGTLYSTSFRTALPNTLSSVTYRDISAICEDSTTRSVQLRNTHLVYRVHVHRKDTHTAYSGLFAAQLQTFMC